jgi:hypothetical protein
LRTNRPVEDWGKLLGDAAAVTAMVPNHQLAQGPGLARSRARRRAQQEGSTEKSWKDPMQSDQLLLGKPKGHPVKTEKALQERTTMHFRSWATGVALRRRVITHPAGPRTVQLIAARCSAPTRAPACFLPALLCCTGRASSWPGDNAPIPPPSADRCSCRRAWAMCWFSQTR